MSNKTEHGPEKLREQITARAYTQYALYLDAIRGSEEKTTPWTETSEAIRNSYLEVYDFYDVNPDATVIDLHNRWVSKRQAAGYRYGDTLCNTRMTDPRICEYFLLPAHIRIKDAILYTAIYVQKHF